MEVVVDGQEWFYIYADVAVFFPADTENQIANTRYGQIVEYLSSVQEISLRDAYLDLIQNLLYFLHLYRIQTNRKI